MAFQSFQFSERGFLTEFENMFELPVQYVTRVTGSAMIAAVCGLVLMGPPRSFVAGEMTAKASHILVNEDKKINEYTFSVVHSRVLTFRFSLWRSRIAKFGHIVLGTNLTSTSLQTSALLTPLCRISKVIT